jgi:tRNA (guanine26-N2/guanine27-N2)-dimethyltransferase
MAALGGSHPETCYGRYASMPIPRVKYLQELALRILLCSLATTAAKYGRSIKPVLSVGMHFYVRVFVEICDDKAAVCIFSKFPLLIIIHHLLQGSHFI